MWYAGYADPKALLRCEITALQDEGYLIPDAWKQKAETMEIDSPDACFQELQEALKKLEKKPDYPFVEPDDLNGIRQNRPARRMQKTALPYSVKELENRYLGAWLGRCAGCALGKPVEGLGMRKKHQGIRNYLEERGDWPLRDYVSGRELEGSEKLDCPASTRERIAFMESDDDIRYTLLGLMIFEAFGKDFTSAQIAELWHRTLTLFQVCTAERQALLNYGMFFAALPPKKFDADFTSSFNNPYREWIGAQIRADFFGFMAPGDPEKAGEYAWRDAVWTHRKNGIYGEMFIAAVEAAAFVTNDVEELIAAGLGEIPEKSRLAFELGEAWKVLPRYRNMDEFMQYADVRFEAMSPVHTINNAVLCMAALYYGRMKPDASIFEAVTGGLDTDCNGATVGAITGIAAGGAAFGGILAPRLNDLIRSEMTGFGDVKISDLAKRTLQAYLKTQEG